MLFTLDPSQARKLTVRRGDITRVEVDVVVNAANQALSGGGGVDGAIHAAAGPELLAECRGLRRCPTGQAVATDAYRLPASHVVHTPGPVWNGGESGEDELLWSCYANSLAVASSLSAKSVAFPTISTGAYRFPRPRAARIAITATATVLARYPSIQSVVFVCFDRVQHREYHRLLDAAAFELPNSLALLLPRSD